MVKLDFQIHHTTYPEGESTITRCPYCKKMIEVNAQTPEYDDDLLVITLKKAKARKTEQ